MGYYFLNSFILTCKLLHICFKIILINLSSGPHFFRHKLIATIYNLAQYGIFGLFQ